MFKALSLWLDRKLGVGPGWGWSLVLLALAVLMQWVAAGIALHRAGWLQRFVLLLQ